MMSAELLSDFGFGQPDKIVKILSDVPYLFL